MHCARRSSSSSLQAPVPTDDVCLHEDAGDSGSPWVPVYGRYLGKGSAAQQDGAGTGFSTGHEESDKCLV